MDALLIDDTLLLSRLPRDLSESIMSALNDIVSSRITTDDLLWSSRRLGRTDVTFVRRIDQDKVSLTSARIVLVVSTNDHCVFQSSSCEKDNGPQTVPDENTSWLSEFVGRIPDVPSQDDDCIAIHVNGIAMYGDVVLPDVASVFQILKRRFELGLSVNATARARIKIMGFILALREFSCMPLLGLSSYLTGSCLLLNRRITFSDSSSARITLLAAVDTMS